MQGTVIRPKALGQRWQIEFARVPAGKARCPDAVAEGDAFAEGAVGCHGSSIARNDEKAPRDLSAGGAS